MTWEEYTEGLKKLTDEQLSNAYSTAAVVDWAKADAICVERDRRLAERAEWKPISTAPEDTVVETKIDDERGVRNQTHLVRQRNLWFFPDKSMYVYYAPTHWREKRTN